MERFWFDADAQRAPIGLLSGGERRRLQLVLTLRAKPQAVATSVGLYITAAYWFTASTSFANPAVTVARAFSDTFAGIRPDDVILFVVAQLAGAVCALWLCAALVRQRATVPAE